ncbi:hypothetical protein ACIGNX_22010 [Actinosynnema sp. NPDC053489]|uniref:hypothetical protein n=1 Tax=Actinosynnema sp. NPDC053489 TaxID=3363916 RepID=UPI0037C8C937
MDTTITAQPDDLVEDGLPISQFDWITKPAPRDAVVKAYERGVKLGLDDDLALALAEAAVDPAKLRAEFASPKQRHLDGCTITYVTLDVWAPAVVPSLENIRFEGARGHWNAHPDQKLLPRFGSADGAAALTLTADNPAHVVDVVSPLVADALAINERVKTIPLRGVEEPVMLAFARVSFRDGDPVTVLEPVDGFCRVAQTHSTLGVKLMDALITYNTRPSERVNLINNLLTAGRTAQADPEDEQDVAATKATSRARLRSLVLQKAMVIIGFAGPGHVPFDQARRRLVGRLHLSPPLEFTPAAMFGAKARAAVEALSGAGRLPVVTRLSSDQVEYALLGDATTPIPRGGPPKLKADELAALALRTMRPRTAAAERDVRLAIRDLTGQLPSAADCQQIAAEIGLRAAPGVTTTVAQRAALARAWQIGAFTDTNWKVTRRPVGEILDEALVELGRLRRGLAKTAPSITELGALASWYLVTAAPHPLARSGFGTKRSVTRPGPKDNREPNTLLRAMMQDADGLKQLAQVVYDGRAGRVLTVLPRGTRPTDVHRPDAADLDESALRNSVATTPRPRGDGNGEPADGHGTTDGTGADHDSAGDHRTPEDDWVDAQYAVQVAAAEMHRATNALLAVKTSNGQTFAATLGFRDHDVNSHLANIQRILHGLDFQREMHLQTMTDTEAEAGDDE